MLPSGMVKKRRLSNLKWRTIHIGTGKSRRYMKVALQKHTNRTVIGKPRRSK